MNVKPRYTVNEEIDHITISVCIPGVSQENIDLSFEDQTLELLAKTSELPQTDFQTICKEFALDDYSQKFHLSEGLDTEGIDAQLDAGMLTISIPKLESEKPKKIEVKERIH